MKLYQLTHTHAHIHTHSIHTQSSQQTCDDDIETAQSGFILDHDNRYGKLVRDTDQKNTQHNHKKKTNGKRTYT